MLMLDLEQPTNIVQKTRTLSMQGTQLWTQKSDRDFDASLTFF